MGGREHYCAGCGDPVKEHGHEACARRQAYDPARFCAACGHRLDVQVYPCRVEAQCRECRRRARQAAPPP